ncbi:aspartyl-trna synthetase [Maribius pontilimi]|uniref:Aspartyl-trna synthetase n=1 Tax=Palleronia pontilimi TaxID=1964209 RepID=A0A934IBH8_9RHOB|nr:SH3 domain-containing protein [Palleronia pontilimi]MBJ3762591.1 aspartyl-trna synthetase [Palleronia pontilimi]
MAATWVRAAWVIAVVLLAAPTGPVLADGARGSETNLPLPRFVSMKATEGNVRRGPSLSHRVDWIYRRKDLPLKITAEHGHWRRVQDPDGMGGWVHYSLLSGVRTAIVHADEVALLMKPVEGAPENARARRGVVARVDRCLPDWCRLRTGGHKGWVRKAALWGIGASETFD